MFIKIVKYFWRKLKVVAQPISKIIDWLKSLLRDWSRMILKLELDELRTKIDFYDRFFSFVPPGHYYSPIYSIDDVLKEEARIWGPLPENIPGINLNVPYQLDLLARLESFQKDIPFTEHGVIGQRFKYDNPFYGYSDALLLFGMIRYLKPKRIIEVGSGYSSALILDTKELFFGASMKCTFIEPYPKRLKKLLKAEDHNSVEIKETVLQNIEIGFFDSLQESDILFIDSTHVSKIGSDVNYIIHEILPRIGSGVYVHFHDIFYPFEYPKDWIREGRQWNELYLMRSFLQFNNAFRIELFNSYLKLMHGSETNKVPLDSASALWLRKQ